MTKERMAYLKELAEEFDVELGFVIDLACLLGENEDYDGLVTSLEDYAGY